MSLATTRARLASPSLLSGRCPSPPPSATAAFFESPFSPPRRPGLTRHRAVSTAVVPPLSPSVCAGFAFEALIAEEQETEEDEPVHGPCGGWRRRTSEWTPLAARAAALPKLDTQETEDRLDRLLAEMSPPEPALAKDSTLVQPAPAPECWELRRLETRFHPLQSPASPRRPCLKPSSSPSPLSSIPSASRLPSPAFNLTHPPLREPEPSSLIVGPLQSPLTLFTCRQDDQKPAQDPPSGQSQKLGETVGKVRFDDEQIEEILTWSSESYDRKGPQPITKLNIRELIELRLIKEELGISPYSSTSSPSTSLSVSTTSMSPQSSRLD